jgi:Arc/MetJ family transcription regulator
VKTAISLDDDLLHEADVAARRMGVSRSRLFADAVSAYLKQARQQEILDRLNRVHGGPSDPAEQRTVRKMKSRFRAVIEDHW